MAQRAMAALIWDIQAQHLDEVEFLLEAHARAMASPKYTLAMVEAGLERRLLAHVDGLRVGGEAVLAKLLLPALDEGEVADDHERAAAAAFVILESADEDSCARVLAAFDGACLRGDERAREALRSALGRTRRRGLGPWLGRDLGGLDAAVVAGRVAVLRDRRYDPGAALEPWLTRAEPELRLALAELAPNVREASHRAALAPTLSRWMQGEHPDLRHAAITCGLIHGHPGAWPALVAQRSRSRWALDWLARLGDASAHAWLVSELRARPDAALLWAAGSSGRPAAVEAALALLDHPRLARLAGEVACRVAGAPLEDETLWRDRGQRPSDDPERTLPALEDDALEAELVPPEDLAVRLPNPEALRSWWAQRRDAFDTSLRYCWGRPFALPAVRAALDEAPLRHRHGLALELAARSRGRAQLDTRALVCAQRAQLRDALAELERPPDFQAGLAPPP